MVGSSVRPMIGALVALPPAAVIATVLDPRGL
jgi:hypothetical protein